MESISPLKKTNQSKICGSAYRVNALFNLKTNELKFSVAIVNEMRKQFLEFLICVFWKKMHSFGDSERMFFFSILKRELCVVLRWVWISDLPSSNRFICCWSCSNTRSPSVSLTLRSCNIYCVNRRRQSSAFLGSRGGGWGCTISNSKWKKQAGGVGGVGGRSITNPNRSLNQEA